MNNVRRLLEGSKSLLLCVLLLFERHLTGIYFREDVTDVLKASNISTTMCTAAFCYVVRRWRLQDESEGPFELLCISTRASSAGNITN
jgi:hypothetical protein